jgi:hypothetical protein
MALPSSPLEKSSRYGICHIYEMTFEASSPIVKAVLTAHCQESRSPERHQMPLLTSRDRAVVVSYFDYYSKVVPRC